MSDRILRLIQRQPCSRPGSTGSIQIAIPSNRKQIMSQPSLNIIFVNVNHPREACQRSKDADIRSHVASFQRLKKKAAASSKSTSSSSSSSSSSPSDAAAPASSVLAIRTGQWPGTARRRPATSTKKNNLKAEKEQENEQNQHQNQHQNTETCLVSTQSPPIPRLQGGCRVDPFQSYPIPFRPYIPELVDHCIPPPPTIFFLLKR